MMSWQDGTFKLIRISVWQLQSKYNKLYQSKLYQRSVLISNIFSGIFDYFEICSRMVHTFSHTPLIQNAVHGNNPYQSQNLRLTRVTFELWWSYRWISYHEMWNHWRTKSPICPHQLKLSVHGGGGEGVGIWGVGFPHLVVANETRTVGKRAVRILLEYCCWLNICNSQLWVRTSFTSLLCSKFVSPEV